jgi:aspartyl/asparaginyl beta-hydroxylase (cupin superfamily)
LRRAFFWTSDRLNELGDALFYRWSGGENRPVFFDVERTIPELRRVDEAYDAIREELLAILPERPRIPRYHRLDGEQTAISKDDVGAWRTFFVSLHWAGDELATRARCPNAALAVEGIPDFLQAFFSILEPGTPVPPHNGPALTYLRYHTAFIVPRERPPTIRVREERYTWKEGESVLFDDSWNHEVFNESEEMRVVLVVDVLRPMPWPLSTFNRFLRWMRIPRWGKRAALLNKVRATQQSA